MIEYFLDSYAIIKYFAGDAKFKPYFKKEISITTKLNMMEVYYSSVRDYGEEMAELFYDNLLLFEYPISDETIKSAMKKRLELKKRGKDISYVDAVGYQLALDLKVKFVTGDKEFKDLENVIFIK